MHLAFPVIFSIKCLDQNWGWRRRVLIFLIYAKESRRGMNNLLDQNGFLVYMTSDIKKWGGFLEGTSVMDIST